ncbi:hypothetical protein NQ315_001979 [Exocentrus adspersus]|uniref:UDP-glycosyltransferase n=1 Tax=Exocentrus adspersus TaxID=1586481 RepID=A0AAV8WB00_9CUCU|nr:hypothetical protein NQ315_001979 [Exocentrus adspersus]
MLLNLSLAVFCCVFLFSNCDGANILAILPCPSYSHQIAYTHLWKALSLRGHKVTLVTPDPINDPSLTNLTEIDMKWIYKYVTDISEAAENDKMSTWSFHLGILKVMKVISDAQLSSPVIKDLIKGSKQFDVIFVEFLVPEWLALSEVYKCPKILFASMEVTASFYHLTGNPAHPILHPEFVSPYHGQLSFRERVMSTILSWYWKLLFQYRVFPERQEVMDKHFHTTSTIKELISDVDLLMLSISPLIQGPRALSPNVISLAGYREDVSLESLPLEVKKFLDDAIEGCIYISFGSNIKSSQLSHRLSKELLEALSEVPYKVLWKFETDVEGLPKHIKTAKWLPQQKVLNHPNVKVLLFQGGLQSMEEAIYGEVPFVVIPFFSDQYQNAKILTNKGVALVEVMTNPKYRDEVKKLKQLVLDEPMTGVEKAVWWTEYVIRHKGAKHLRNPAADLPFYQYYLLDEVKRFLDNATEGCIYLSLGSNVKSSLLSQRLSKELFQAIREIPYKVLWKFEKDLGEFPENIKTAKWLPQQKILNHPNVKVFLFQGGLQSMEEGVYGEVAFVVIPFFSDQHHNAGILKNKGAGIVLDKATLKKDELKAALVEVMTNSKYRNAVKKLKRLVLDEPMKGVDKAVWWTEYVIRHKGAKHLRNPAADLPLYQYYLLDVIGFLSLVALLTTLIVAVTLKKLCKLISRQIKLQIKETLIDSQILVFRFINLILVQTNTDNMSILSTYIFFGVLILPSCFCAKILAVVPTPSHSHQIAFTPLWKELSLRGHKVTVVTTDPQNDPTLTNLTEIDTRWSYKSVASVGKVVEDSLDMWKFLDFLHRIVTEVSDAQLSYEPVQKLMRSKEGFDVLLVEVLYPEFLAFAEIYNCPTILIASFEPKTINHHLMGNPGHPVLNPDFATNFFGNLNFKERVISTVYDWYSTLYTSMKIWRSQQLLLNKYFNTTSTIEELLGNVDMMFTTTNPIIQAVRAVGPSTVAIGGNQRMMYPKPLPKNQTALNDPTGRVKTMFAIYLSLVFFIVPSCICGDILAVIPTPSHSHQVAFVPLWKELSLRGHKVTVITTDPLNDPKLKNLTEIDIRSVYKFMASTMKNMQHNEINMWNTFDRFTDMTEGMTDEILSNRKIRDLLKPGKKFDVVLVEMFFPEFLAFAELYNSPKVLISSLEANSFIHRLVGNPTHPVVTPEFLTPFYGDLSFKERVISTIFDRYLELYVSKRLFRKKEYVLGKYFNSSSSIVQLISDVDLIFVNTNPVLLEVAFAPLWKELSLRGHKITVITTDPQNDPKLKNLKEIDIRSAYKFMAEVMKTIQETEITMWNTIGSFIDVSERMVDEILSQRETRDLMKPEKKFDVVLVEVFYPELLAFAEIYNCPKILVSPMEMNSFIHRLVGNPTHPVILPEFLTPFYGDLSFKERVIITLTVVSHGADILAIMPTPSYSHQIAYLNLWKELSLRGHKVTLITTDPFRDPTLKNLTEIDLSFFYRYLENVNHDGDNAITMWNMHKELMKMLVFTEIILSNNQVQDLIPNKTFDVVLVEFLFPEFLAFAEIYKCPKILISSLPLTEIYYSKFGSPSHPVLNPDFATPFYTPLNFIERVTSTVYHLYIHYFYKFENFPTRQRILGKYFNVTRNLEEIVEDLDMAFVNVNPVIHGARALSPTVIEIGSFREIEYKNLSNDLQQFLDGAKEGFIYFSLGSNVKSKDLKKETLTAIIEALRQLPYKVLWKFEADELPGKPDNVKLIKWTPQQSVLAHPNIKLFITQGGLQSMEEAIYSEVPLVVMPFFGDQEQNAKLMVSKGIAVRVDVRPYLDKENLKKAIIEVISNPKYKNAIIRLKQLALDTPMTGLEKAVWWTEYVIRNKGAKHLRNPAADIPLYQYYLLDCKISASIYCIQTWIKES